ncbi:MAG: hypothetical protein BZ137_02230 [Methanosphaera sp. rholeuAM130]|nr:hypothetical protein [Methanosphaera sp.]RAP54468.1 MAG: hypothetical protein BZ137_02230 [Methanosphaera sp. rholeuAM130]
MDLYDYNKEEDIMTFKKEVYHKKFALNINPYIKIELNDSSMVIGLIIRNASFFIKKPKDQICLYKIRCSINTQPGFIELEVSTQYKLEKPEKFTINRNINMDIVGTEFIIDKQ